MIFWLSVRLPATSSSLKKDQGIPGADGMSGEDDLLAMEAVVRAVERAQAVPSHRRSAAFLQLARMAKAAKKQGQKQGQVSQRAVPPFRPDGCAALHMACGAGGGDARLRCNLIRQMVELKADLTARDTRGATPLLRAAGSNES